MFIYYFKEYIPITNKLLVQKKKQNKAKGKLIDEKKRTRKKDKINGKKRRKTKKR